MPLTKSGKKTLGEFKKEYGIVKGEKYFNAYLNKYPNRAKKLEGKK